MLRSARPGHLSFSDPQMLPKHLGEVTSSVRQIDTTQKWRFVHNAGSPSVPPDWLARVGDEQTKVRDLGKPNCQSTKLTTIPPNIWTYNIQTHLITQRPKNPAPHIDLSKLNALRIWCSECWILGWKTHHLQKLNLKWSAKSSRSKTLDTCWEWIWSWILNPHLRTMQIISNHHLFSTKKPVATSGLTASHIVRLPRLEVLEVGMLKIQ